MYILRAAFAAVVVLVASVPTFAQTTAGSSTSIVVPVTAQTASFTSEITVYNPNGVAVTVDVAFYEADNSTNPGLRTCIDVAVPAGKAVQFTLALQCALGAGSHFGLLVLSDVAATNPIYGYVRTQNPQGIGFSTEGFPAENFNNQVSHSTGLKKTTSGLIYQTNCFAGSLAQAVTYTLKLFDGTSNAQIGSTINGSLAAFRQVRYLDIFSAPPNGVGPVAGDQLNVRAEFTPTNNALLVGFCTVQDNTSFGADFRIAKSYGTTAAYVQGGNSFGTTAILGTTDNFPLEIRANNSRAVRIEPNATSPNLALGNPVNVAGGFQVYGATVSGGGRDTTDCFDQVSLTRTCANKALAGYSTVGGGIGNFALDVASVVGGGSNNVANNYQSTVAGGGANFAAGSWSTIGGGVRNTVNDSYSTVAGGTGNTASAQNSTVGGGFGNLASNLSSLVSGGDSNTASNTGATVGGGEGSTASGYTSTVAGGASNTASGDNSTVSGGQSNTANAIQSTVTGGYLNLASGVDSIVAGGEHNTASGILSLAAGFHAAANADGCFVWGDYSTGNTISCNAANRFVVRSLGGVFFFAGGNTQATYSGVALPPGGTAWVVASDRALKENVRAVDARQVLEQLVVTPIATWNLKAQDASIRHMGPMAQDFRAAFNLGETELGINTIDADGVAFAAIQGLNAKLEAKVAEQARENADLRERLARVELLQADVTALKAAMIGMQLERTPVAAR